MLKITIFILITIISLPSSVFASSSFEIKDFIFIEAEEQILDKHRKEENHLSNSGTSTNSEIIQDLASMNSFDQIRLSQHLPDSTKFFAERKHGKPSQAISVSQIEQKFESNAIKSKSEQNTQSFQNVENVISRSLPTTNHDVQNTIDSSQLDFLQNAKRIISPHTDKFLTQRFLEQEEESLSGLLKALKILVIFMKVMTQIMSALLPGNSTSLLLGISFKLTTRIKYMDVTYSTDLYKSFYDAWNEKYLSLGYSFGMPDFVGYNQSPKQIPFNFMKYGIMSNFLINFWESLVILIFVMLVYIAAQLTESLLANNKNSLSTHQVAQKIRVSIQCLLLTQLYIIFGDIILFACLEWRYLDLSQAFTTLSFGFSLLFTVLPIGCLVLQFLLVQKFQQDRNTNSTTDDDERVLDFYKLKYPVSQIFFKDFKTQGITTQSFLFLLILRDVLFSIVIAFLSISPLAQSIILVIFSLPLGVFLVVFRPFKNWWNMTQQIFYELIIFIVAIDVIIMETFDQSNEPAVNPRKKIGLSIIIVQICFVSIGLIYLFVMFLVFLSDLYKNCQLSQNVQNRSERLRDLNIRISQGIFPIPIEESMIQQERLIIGSTTGNSQIMMRQEEVFNFDDTLEVPSEKFNSSNQSVHMSMSNTNPRWKGSRKKIFPINKSRPNEDSFYADDSFLNKTAISTKRPLRQRRNRRQLNKSMSQFPSSDPGFAYLKKNEGMKASQAHNLMGKTYLHSNSTNNNEENKTKSSGIQDFKSKRGQILEDLNKKYVQKPKVNSLNNL